VDFANEPGHRASRQFECGWPFRPQTAEDIAIRVQELARRLGAIDPAFGQVRPDPGMRKFREGDLGAVIDMTPSELADLIERRGRFDPPKFPAAVSSQGYSMLYRNDRLDFTHLSIGVGAGSCELGANRNRISISPDRDHPLWRNLDHGIQVIDAMAEGWGAQWASAYAWRGRDEGGVRPWLAWTSEPLRLEPTPPYIQPYPYPFALDNVALPAEVRPWRGGELRIWP
jgi:hypothetical protein